MTDKILTEIEDWQTRPLDSVYPIVFIDAVHFSVRDNGIVRKLAAYVMLGINCDGEKDIISLSIGENESAKYWLGVLNELKNRGVQDIMVICADGLTGIKEANSTAFPKTEYQRCIVHMVRNTLKHVSYKDMKAFATDLKSIYLAPTEEKARTNLDAVSEKRSAKYPHSMNRWYDNRDAVCPIFKFSMEVQLCIRDSSLHYLKTVRSPRQYVMSSPFPLLLPPHRDSTARYSFWSRAPFRGSR